MSKYRVVAYLYLLAAIVFISPNLLHADTETIYPDDGATGGTNAWTITNTGDPPGAVLNDATATTYYSSATINQLGYAGTANPVSVGSNCVDSVRVYYKAYTNGDDDIDFGIRNGSTDSLAGSSASNGTGAVSVAGSETEYWEEWTTPPGGSWDLNNLEAHFQQIKVGGQNTTYVTEARVVITYHAADVYNSENATLYCKIQDAVGGLGGSIAAAQYIELRSSNTYSETVTFSGITGTSSSNTLTLKAQSGQAPKITGSTTGITISDPYIVLEGLRISGAGSSHGVSITSTGDNAAIRNTIIDNNTTDEINIDGADGIVIKNCTIYDNDGNNLLQSTGTISTGISIRNSIFYQDYTITGATNIIFYTNGLSQIATTDYNVYYTTTTAYVQSIIDWDGTTPRTLSVWQTSSTSNNANSLYGNANFVSLTGGSENFHLQSTTGRWTGGTTCGVATFTTDSVQSPAIDAGDIADSYTNECGYNGGRVNAGAYGNTVQASKTPAPLFRLTASADITPASIYAGQSNVEFLRVAAYTEKAPALNQVKVDVKGNGNLANTDVSAVKVYISSDTVLDIATDTFFGQDTTNDIVTNGGVVNGSYNFPSANTTSYLFIVLDISSTAAGDETIWIEQQYNDTDAINYYSSNAYTVENTASPVYFQTDGGTGQAIISGTSFNLKSRVDNISGKTVGPGQTLVHFMSVKVDTTGTPNLTQVEADIAGTVADADVTAFRVYISADSNFDNGTDVVFGTDTTSLVSGNAIATGSYTGASNATYYALLVLDIASGTAGKTVDITQSSPATLYLTSGTETAVNDPYVSTTVTISNLLTVCASGCGYTTLQAAVDAIPASPTTAYIVEVRDSGTYAGVDITGKTTSASNTITMRVQSGNAPVVDPTGGDQYGFEVNGVNYVTIDGFRITGAPSAGIFLTGASNCTLSHNVIYGMTGSADMGISLNSSSNTNKIVNNTLYNNMRNIYITGTSTGAEIKNNIMWVIFLSAVEYAYDIYFGDTGSQSFTADYNNLYLDATERVGYYNGGGITSLSSWSGTTGQDANSISSNPQFVNAGSNDLHIKSKAGSCSLSSGTCTWANDTVDSPSLDKGTPTDGYANETSFNGQRINQGAYGNTFQASRTPKQFNLQSRVDNAASKTFYSGTTNNHFMSVKVTTVGDPTITQVNVNLGGTVADADLSQVSVYISPDAVFDSASDTSFGIDSSSVVTSTATITGSYTGSMNAAYYVLFLLDFNSSAATKTVYVTQTENAEDFYTASASYTTNKSAVNDPYTSTTKTIGSTDTGGPKLLSVSAEDTSGGGPGIDSGDTVKLIFDETTDAHAVNTGNINSVLTVSGKTWGGVTSAVWSATTYSNDTLTITLDGTGSPDVASGESITIGANTIEDGSANDALGSPPKITGSFEMKPAWTASAAGIAPLPFEGTPIVRLSNSIETVFVGNNDGILYAFRTDTGAQRWTYNVGTEIMSQPNVLNSEIYFGANDGKVYGLVDGATPTKKSWAPKSISASPVKSSCILATVSSELRIFVGGDDNKLHCFRQSDGSTVWNTSDLGGIVTSTPAVFGDGYVYVGAENGSVAKINVTNGQVSNSASGLTKVSASPTLDKTAGYVFIGAWDNKLRVFAASNMAENVCFGTSGCGLNDATLQQFKGAVFYTGGKIYIGNSNNKAYCLQFTAPSTLAYCANWSSYDTSGDGAGEIVSMPVLFNSYVYFGSTNGWFYILNDSNGTLHRKFYTGEPIVTSPAFRGNQVIVSSKSGKVYKFALPLP